MLGIALTQVQGFALGLTDLDEVHVGPPLKPVRIPLDSILFLQHVNHTMQFCVIGALDEVALNFPVLIADEKVKQSWSQYCDPLATALCLDSEP